MNQLCHEVLKSVSIRDRYSVDAFDSEYGVHFARKKIHTRDWCFLSGLNEFPGVGHKSVNYFLILWMQQLLVCNEYLL